MARFIDADKLIEHIKDLPTWFKEDGWWHSTKYPDGHLDCDDVINSIDNAPTADVVEVVRCRNCKHAYFRYNTRDTLQEIYACEKRPAGRAHKKVSGDFFCKHGQRKEGD